MKDINLTEVNNGDIIDIHQTVNGQNLFVIISVEPLDIRYHYNLERKYEYDKEELLQIDWVLEEGFEIIGNIGLEKLGIQEIIY